MRFDVKHVSVTKRLVGRRLTAYIGPLLLGYADRDIDIKEEAEPTDSWKALPKHRDENQVQLDVDRSFIYYPNGASLLWSHITMELTCSHRPVLKRDRQTKNRTL
jgi:hypothetical protein